MTKQKPVVQILRNQENEIELYVRLSDGSWHVKVLNEADVEGIQRDLDKVKGGKDGK